MPKTELYWDEAGRKHKHNHGVNVEFYICSQGHEWETRYYGKCFCGWDGEKYKMVRWDDVSVASINFLSFWLNNDIVAGVHTGKEILDFCEKHHYNIKVEVLTRLLEEMEAKELVKVIDSNYFEIDIAKSKTLVDDFVKNSPN